MQTLLFFLTALSALGAIPTSTAVLPAAVGQPAPNFTLNDREGKALSLSDFKGKFVVLEWVNFGCPFVQAHYNSGNMPALQKTYQDRGVIWLSICSSAPGNQGYLEESALKSRMEEMKSSPSAYLIDADGTVGRLYAAKTTPTMYVVNPRGTLIYAGGIDDTPATEPSEIANSRNYVREALDSAMDGKPVEVTYSRSYGCSVKY